MHRIRYRIKTIAPVVISSKAGDMNIVSTEHYIPGTTVLGMLASQVIVKKGLASAHEDCQFYDWFLAGKLKISNAYIYSKNKKGKEYSYVPVPFSIQKEKKDETKIYNLLYTDDEDLKDVQTKSIDNFCVPHGLSVDIGEDKLYTKGVESSLNFHHGRNREKGVSEEGNIFNYESISEDQMFEGEITGESCDLLELYKVIDNESLQYIGRSKSAQYGKILFEWVDHKPIPVTVPEIEPDQDLVSLVFLSDTILYNENGFSTVDINVLEKYLDAKIDKSFIKKGRIETFVSKWKLRKPSEVCFRAGSTFLLKDISAADHHRLAMLQQTRIGERTHEGFGRCIFGWSTDSHLQEEKSESLAQEKPSFDMPETTKTILITLIKDTIRKSAVQKGIADQREFKTFPSNALLGRLMAMLKGNNTPAAFSESLNRLRKPARNQLESHHNGSQTLFDFLMKAQSLLANLIENNDNLNKVCREINFNPQEDNELNKIHQVYLEAFFSMMRKRSHHNEDRYGDKR